MDTLAHGLWGSIAVGRNNGISGRRSLLYFVIAALLGMAPDLIAFGPRFFQWAQEGFPNYRIEPGTYAAPALDSLSAYVFTAYNVTHTLLVWLLLFAVVWFVLRRPLWILMAWGLHILCDIPTHSTRYFPTPFLWPFKTPYVNGLHWAQPWFLILNYSLLACFFVWIFWRSRSKQ